MTTTPEAGMRPAFGDIVENGWASEDNPTRTGFFVREFRRTGKLNPGLTWEITDGKGKFWEFNPKDIAEDNRLKVTRAAAPGPPVGEVVNSAHAAYGALWCTMTDNPVIHAARNHLLAAIGGRGSDAQREAIKWAGRHVQPPSDAEIMAIDAHPTEPAARDGGEADKMAHVLLGMVARGTVIDADAVEIGKYITFSESGEHGNAVVSPEISDGVYWTLIGSGPDWDQNRQAAEIVRRLNLPMTSESGLRPITMQDVRLAVGEGPLKPADVLAGCNAELVRRKALISPAGEVGDEPKNPNPERETG